jgi:hypothetical protein
LINVMIWSLPLFYLQKGVDMSDVAVVMVKDNRELNKVIVYIHSNGAEALTHLRNALPRMRKNDSTYSTARLIGYLHTQISDNLGLGCWPAGTGDLDAIIESYEDVDAGFLLYDCSTGIVKCYNGYLCDEIPDDGLDIGTPPR